MAKGRISAEQVEHFKREGYVIPEVYVFPEAKFQALKDHFEAKLAALPEGTRPEAMDVPHFLDPKLLEWVLSDEVLDLVEPILGPDICLFSTHFICKPSGDGKRVPWHEDSAYWKPVIEPHPIEIATVWLAIDPSTTKNGCMKVIPRTHVEGQKGYSDYDEVDKEVNVFGTEITKRQRREELSVPVELRPNQASLHDARLMHGSDPNNSDMRRCGYTMRFASTKVRISGKFKDIQLMYLARGRMPEGREHEFADPTKAYPEVVEARRARGFKAH